MSRKRGRTTRRPPTLAGLWTIQRASGIGIGCGLAAVLSASFASDETRAVLYPYVALLALTALCGASILWITAFDMRARGTSGRMRPIRGFDAALGLLLLVPALYALALLRPTFGL